MCSSDLTEASLLYCLFLEVIPGSPATTAPAAPDAGSPAAGSVGSAESVGSAGSPGSTGGVSPGSAEGPTSGSSVAPASPPPGSAGSPATPPGVFSPPSVLAFGASGESATRSEPVGAEGGVWVAVADGSGVPPPLVVSAAAGAMSKPTLSTAPSSPAVMWDRFTGRPLGGEVRVTLDCTPVPSRETNRRTTDAPTSSLRDAVDQAVAPARGSRTTCWADAVVSRALMGNRVRLS